MTYVFLEYSIIFFIFWVRILVGQSLIWNKWIERFSLIMSNLSYYNTTMSNMKSILESPCPVYLSVCYHNLICSFYAPGMKGPPGTSSNRIGCPSVCLSVIPSRLQTVLYLKFGLWFSNQTWTVSSSMGSSHFIHNTCPWGWGQNGGLRDFAIFWLCCCWGHPCFTNTCLVV